MGLNDRIKRSSPTQVGTDTTWSTSAVISRFSPIVPKTDGTMWSWGNNNHGQLGLNQTSNLKLSSPAQIPGTTWSSVAGLGNRVLALKTNGTLWSWGYNHEGVLGQGQEPAVRNSLSSPTQIGARTDWGYVDTSQGNGKSIKAITTDGKLWVWGKNYGEYSLGVGPGKNAGAFSSPTQVANITTNWGTASAYDTDYAWTAAGTWGAGFVLRQR